MKALRSVNSMSELEQLLEDVGSLVPFAVAAICLQVHQSRIYQLGNGGQVRVFAVFGVYQIPLEDVKQRLQSRRYRPPGYVPPPPPVTKATSGVRLKRPAWLVGVREEAA